MRVSLVTLITALASMVSGAPIANSYDNLHTDYDAIIVGGGPSGLAAASGLARVRRNILLIDSGEYRNDPTRHMHDVLGFDGVTPAYYRWSARNQIAAYGTVTMTNGTVTKIQPRSNNTYFTVSVDAPSDKKESFTARKIILGTGLTDLLPDTPGIKENWGKGIYWCPWCDGHEHADQALGLIGPLDSIPGSVREVLTLNTDIIAFTNGTDTPELRAAADKQYGPGWDAWLKLNNVRIENKVIKSVERLLDGGNTSASHSDPSLPSAPEHDLFQVNLEDGTSVKRAAFLTSFKDAQHSSLGKDLGVRIVGNKLFANESVGLETNVPGVYAIGDANSDNVTNVPHALFTGKRTAVYLHVKLEREEMAAEIAAAANGTAKRDAEESFESLWKRVNGPPGEILYAPEI